MAKSKYASVGQKVHVHTPRQFIRCGYPLNYDTILNEQADLVKELVDPLSALLHKTTTRQGSWLKSLSIGSKGLKDVNLRAHRYLEKAVCAVLIQQQSFGGRERQVYESVEDTTFPQEEEWIVRKKFFVKTGTYFAPYSGYSDHTGEYDYEPGGLSDEQTHCVYSLSTSNHCYGFCTLARNCTWEQKSRS
jgi:hypothetical protein